MKFIDKDGFDKANVFGQGEPNDSLCTVFYRNRFLNPLMDFKKGNDN